MKAKRLQKVVSEMPIHADGNMVDGKPERFPKQIPRYLLPERGNPATRKLLDQAGQNFLRNIESIGQPRKTTTKPFI